MKEFMTLLFPTEEKQPPHWGGHKTFKLNSEKDFETYIEVMLNYDEVDYP